MTDAELLRVARGFRRGILSKRSSNGMCCAICLPLAALLRFYGVRCRLAEGDAGPCNHVWIRLSDGRVLDPTYDQFGGRTAVYLGQRQDEHSQERKGRPSIAAFRRRYRVTV